MTLEDIKASRVTDHRGRQAIREPDRWFPPAAFANVGRRERERAAELAHRLRVKSGRLARPGADRIPKPADALQGRQRSVNHPDPSSRRAAQRLDQLPCGQGFRIRHAEYLSTGRRVSRYQLNGADQIPDIHKTAPIVNRPERQGKWQLDQPQETSHVPRMPGTIEEGRTEHAPLARAAGQPVGQRDLGRELAAPIRRRRRTRGRFVNDHVTGVGHRPDGADQHESSHTRPPGTLCQAFGAAVIHLVIHRRRHLVFL